MIIMNKSKKSIYIVIFVLVFIEICTIFLMYKSSNNQGDLFKNVYTLENSPKDMFAILIEQADGTYKKSEGTSWKDISSIYAYNSTLSGCLDKNGNKLSGVLSYRNGVATVETKTTTSCYLYFSRDKTAPTISNFYLASGNNKELEYINSRFLDAYIEWADEDVVSYCITSDNNSTSCKWQNTSESSIQIKYTLPKYNAENKIYAYLKDAAGNVSSPATDSVVHDATPPEVKNVIRTRISKDKFTLKINAIDDLSGVKDYAVKVGNSLYVINDTSSRTIGELAQEMWPYTISIYVTDKAGNESEEKVITYGEVFGKYLIDNKIKGLSTTIQGGMYRFQGTNADVQNYVCFGTNDKETCLSNPNKYMYRIIGVVTNNDNVMGTKINMVKLIKWDALDKEYIWSGQGDYYWDMSKTNVSPLLKGLNGEYYYTNSNYNYLQDSLWNKKIKDIYWRYTDDIEYDVNQTADTLYQQESNHNASSVSQKISLMYIHDFYYSGKSGGFNCFEEHEDISSCKNSWIHLSNNNPPSDTSIIRVEWTMQRNGWGTYQQTNVYHFACAIWNAGGVHCGTYASNANDYYVRPVFYLIEDIKHYDGTGAMNDPFLLA